MINTKTIPDFNFWKNKKVLVTGHTGFKGAWLCSILKLLGSSVTGYSLAPLEKNSLYDLLDLTTATQSKIANINDLNTLESFIAESKPDIIFHLAAQALVIDSYKDPIETYMTNVIGTLNVFEAARKNNTKVIINVTSDKCYENNNWVWPYRENDRLGGHDPYSSSKACAEILTASYRQSFLNNNEAKTALASVRAGNCIGGGDWSKNRLIPDIIKAVINKETLVIRNPEATRPWQHVLEPLTGYLLLAEKVFTEPKQYADAWNFGPDFTNTKQVAQLVEYAKSELSEHTINIEIDSSGTHLKEAQLLAIDASKAKRKLPWQPRLNFEQTMQYTFSWYKNFLNNKNMKKYTNKQIVDYYELD